VEKVIAEPNQPLRKWENMIDWNLVKKMTLWDYEELTEKISAVLSYSFIQKYYNHNMRDAIDYLQKLLGYGTKYAKHMAKITTVFKSLDRLRVENYIDLIHKVENKEKCEDFLRKTQLSFDDLIFTLNYIFRWVLPHRLYLRELIDRENESHKNYVEELRKCKIRFNLDLLEYGRTREGREKLSKETGIPKSFIVDLVNLADVSRLPYSNRKTVRHLFSGGYNNVAKIAQTDSERMRKDMKSYFDKMGVKLAGFIDLKGIAQWAKTIPIIVEQ
jgi:hypothetical protein